MFEVVSDKVYLCECLVREVEPAVPIELIPKARVVDHEWVGSDFVGAISNFGTKI